MGGYNEINRLKARRSPSAACAMGGMDYRTYCVNVASLPACQPEARLVPIHGHAAPHPGKPAEAACMSVWGFQPVSLVSWPGDGTW
jgi:hypothetical protein